MTQDLFVGPEKLERLPVPEAEIYYSSSFPMARIPREVMEVLIREVPWRAEDIIVWGKKYPQPRLIAWYGDEGSDYSYSGIWLKPLPWLPMLLDLRAAVEDWTKATFNSVLLNYYRDQNDGMGLHSDDEKELGSNPTIASLSLGERRTFLLKHRNKKTLKPIKLPLDSGSLLVMKGETQRNWKHGIEKENRSCGPRVNLTFRRIYDLEKRNEGVSR